MRDPFCYVDDSLHCEDVPLADIAARAGTPSYVYSSRAILETYRAYDEGLAGIPHRICYAVKANSNLAVLALLAKAGAGFDIVSGGELYRVLKAGGDASSVVFSGVGKTADEVEYALREGIHSFNCESEAELALIDALAARLRVKARASFRVNPDVSAETHPYISTGLREHKFGIDIGEAESLYKNGSALRNVEIEGVSCHIGSQLLDIEPILEAVDKMLELVDRLRAAGIPIRSLDLGGGLGIAYRPDEQAPEIREFTARLREKVAGRDLFLILEPGRSIVGGAGVLLTRVLYRKCRPTKEFVVVDAAMNDLIRPSLYQSHHEILPVRRQNRGEILADVVGPVCESGDFLARDRKLANVLPGDVLAVATTGAYGFVAASNYNSRVRPPEILVENGSWRIVRARETCDDLIRGETV
ncbi:MAG TPA: diaminopimelate decarboxylase [Bryobacteraceae bacterium]|nr:diaminopimelate decarboxylase [Bryobacteraceae bacterium]HOL70898.1 diaminopimelate decarboxylase [Bryobacteraceae bacterium]HOQ45348.1 diaminopimelate decarboxylase [Bryobacteraceae bacterium]HPQ13648.1 diaminopimelate decarboxylase [Bryobacteraceae bacterium]HPU71341.1 diaminopimelate decarboxylase [Bryobacteraceae bacterium]